MISRIRNRLQSYSFWMLIVLGAVCVLGWNQPLWAQHSIPKNAVPVYLGFDGAYGQKTSTAAAAIEFGLRSAIEDINAAGGVLGGRPLELLTTDNKGITARGKDNFIDLAQKKDLVAVFGGKYSPIIVESLTEAQRLRIPIISVWGSADQITDSGYLPSYAFRVSLKDSWGVTAILKRITTQLKVQTACAMLPNTTWGRSSDAVIKSQASDLGLSVPVTHWYNWGERSFEAAYSKCLENEGRAILFVGNEQESALLIQEIARRPAGERLPVVAHWGAVGGILHELVREDLKAVRFEVIQTFTFVDNQRPLALRLARAALKANGLSNVADIPSPVGVAQAYDAARLVAMAIDLAQSTRGEDIRAALEKLPAYEGVIKKYAPAFTATRHDALDASSVIFVNITPDGALVPIE